MGAAFTNPEAKMNSKSEMVETLMHCLNAMRTKMCENKGLLILSDKGKEC